MCRALLIILVLALTLGPAEARQRHWGLFGFAFLPHAHHGHAYHHHRYGGQRHSRAVMSAGVESQFGPEGRTYSKADLVPQNWQLTPTDPTFKGNALHRPMVQRGWRYTHHRRTRNQLRIT